VKVSEDRGPPLFEFHCPARKQVVQNIPIINGSNEKWSLRVSWSTKPVTKSGVSVNATDALSKTANVSEKEYNWRELFSGPMDLTVAPHSTEMYPLTFSPPWLCNFKGFFELINNKTEEKFPFEIVGIGEEPAPDETIIIDCQARSQFERRLTVRNYEPGDVEYRVETDLPSITGEPSIFVKRGSSSDYLLQLRPQLSGIHRGSLTFESTIPGGHFLWFAVELNVMRPKPEQLINVNAVVRRAAKIDITVGPNIIDQNLDFVVNLVGTGLIGSSTLTLGPKQTANYELHYSPLKVSDEMGSISFYHPLAGEFWYQLALKAEMSPPTVVPLINCAVGAQLTTRSNSKIPVMKKLCLWVNQQIPANLVYFPQVFGFLHSVSPPFS